MNLHMGLFGNIYKTGQIPIWLQWGYWVSPLSYAFNALAANEMFAPRWMEKLVRIVCTFFSSPICTKNALKWHYRS